MTEPDPVLLFLEHLFEFNAIIVLLIVMFYQLAGRAWGNSFILAMVIIGGIADTRNEMLPDIPRMIEFLDEVYE